MNHQCRICHNHHHNISYQTREMMLGTHDHFNYFQCSQCGCLQIEIIPANLADYYPKQYYSYNDQEKLAGRALRRWGDHKRVLDITQNASLLGKFFNALSKPLDYKDYIVATELSREAKILDIGCGTGRLIMRMHMGGYYHVVGLDPFVEKNIQYSNGVRIAKETIENFADSSKDKFDLIMMHHSLEHMPDQLAPLKAAKTILKNTGHLLIRVPLCDSYAWEHYKENWVQLDAPRHLYLNTKKSMEILADTAGFTIQKIEYDSSKFQFTGSELYLKGIALNAPKKEKDIFTRKQLSQFSKQAEDLNLQAQGDQACFYLQHTR
ncbi:MAG: class I SAM-dependent methyltransferase [Gammaproteobacteria bacterium]|nr:class I SAM-dependent methyltransferase [Gammaproteobacteria bacterium]MDH5801755.1 class I SAM-dependent methyltransferase [Gammaproteobacteria bacterium]